MEEEVVVVEVGAWETLEEVQERIVDRVGPTARALKWTAKAIASDQGEMQIVVKTLRGERIIVEVESSDTVGRALRRLEEWLG